jgi:predicted O-linked N-acetylglucosamine transferase (SPINDLY family)
VGQTFAGRVAGSRLGAAGFPQLATDSPAAYEALALALATDPPRLAALRAELTAARGHCALFDTATYTRHLENGFAAAWERHRAQLPPEHIVVPRLGA